MERWLELSDGTRDENGRKPPQPFSTFTFEYENESENGKAGHKNEHELMKYRKRTNSSRIMSNTVGIQKFNTEYRPVESITINKCMTHAHNNYQMHDQVQAHVIINKCMTLGLKY